MKKGHANGEKFGRHTSLIPAAELLIKHANKDPRISKIVLGRIIGGKHGQYRIKITKTPAGLKIFVRGGHSGQELHVYTSDHAVVTADLERVFQEEFGV